MFQFQLCDRGVWGKFPKGRLYERKLDGTRAFAVKLGDKVKLVNRRGFEYTEQKLSISTCLVFLSLPNQISD